MKRDYKEREKNPEEKTPREISGYSIASGAYSMGYSGRVFKRRSPLPPPTDWTFPEKLIDWPEKK